MAPAMTPSPWPCTACHSSWWRICGHRCRCRWLGTASRSRPRQRTPLRTGSRTRMGRLQNAAAHRSQFLRDEHRVLTTDPVGMGIVQSLARPGGNATGFISAEFGLSVKWLEMLKEMEPGVRRGAVLRESSNPSGLAQFAAIQGVAPSFGVELSPLGVRDAGEIERDVGAFARPGNGGMIVTRIAETIAHRDAIIKAASQSRLPAVYPLRVFVTAGGLISYGPDVVDQYRRAAA